MIKKKTNKLYKEFVLSKYQELKDQDNFTWANLFEIAQEAFPTKATNQETMRSMVRYNLNKGNFKLNKQKAYVKYKNNKTGETSLREQIGNYAKSKHEVESLAARLNITLETLLVEIAKMELDGVIFNKWRENGKSFIQMHTTKLHPSKDSQTFFDVKDEIKFLVIGDTHIGHKQVERQILKDMINKAYDMGVRNVLHTGDILEGHYQAVRPTSGMELEALGLNEQLDLALETFPEREGLQYYTITGNHDYSFIRHSYANPGILISQIRKDFNYLGHNYAKVWLTDKIDVTLVHPDDGIGENYALKLRTHIDRNTDDYLGRFIFMGHYHKFAHLHHKRRDAWVTPSFIRQTSFMAGKNLESLVGAILMTVKVDEHGEVASFTPEYFFFDE